MDGILCINKPEGFTSFDVVAKLRGITQTKRLGHSGTLDPMATGVLPVFLGTATKSIDLIENHTKRYTAGFRLGETTDTLDITGKVLSKSHSDISREQIEQALAGFRGSITQLPPMYSAVKVNGKRLYALARQGKGAERKPRNAEIFLLDLMDFDSETQQGILDVKCSRGTYIRALIDDLGNMLKVGGVMTGLIRTEAGCFNLDDAVGFEQIQSWKDCGCLADNLLPIDHVFKEYDEIHLNQSQSKMFFNGRKLDLRRIKYNQEKIKHRVYNHNGEFMGIATLDVENNELRIKKMLYTGRTF